MMVTFAAETEITFNETQNVLCSSADAELTSSLDVCNLPATCHKPDTPAVISQSEVNDETDQHAQITWSVP